MKTETMLGQMIMVGFEGESPNEDITSLIRDYHVGGVILFSKNITNPNQAARLTNTLQSLSSEPLFIAVDQESGRVSRLPESFTYFPGNGPLGAINSVPLAYAFAEATAKELKAIGINMNLAPVLDVDTNPQNPVIGDRSFGKDPLLVSRLGLAVVAGLQDNRVIACGKHFPGHGDTAMDSHIDLPKVTHTLDRLKNIELKPFYHTIDNGLEAVMTAHVLYTAIDDRYPATLSKKVLEGLLRKEIGFKGIVITDDLGMGAIEKNYQIEKAGALALEAGADILLICHDIDKQKRAIESLHKALRSGKISKKRTEESYSRILGVKKKYLSPYRPVNLREISKVVGCEAHKKVAQGIIDRAKKKGITI